jgi:hypothetical protein
MGLGVDISFENFLIDLNVNEKNYILQIYDPLLENRHYF